MLVGCLIVFSIFLLSTHLYQIHNETLLFTPYHGEFSSPLSSSLASSHRAISLPPSLATHPADARPQPPAPRSTA